MSAACSESWWLDTSAFPDLVWARLTAFPDGTAEVFDIDGRSTRFSNHEQARLFLSEDEYAAVDTITANEFAEVGLSPKAPQPPEANSDAELPAQMLVRRTPARNPSAQVSQNDSKLRRGGKHCPLCLVVLPKNSRRTRTRRSCIACGANPQPLKQCRRCSATAGAVWEGPTGAACSICGLHGSKKKLIAPARSPKFRT